MEDLSKSITEKEISKNEFVGYANIIREIVIAKLKRRDRLRSVKVIENTELDNFKVILGDIYRLNYQNPWLSYIVYLCRIKERQIKSPINVTAKVIGRTRSVVDTAITKLYNTVSCHAYLVDPNKAIDDNVKITPDTRVSVFLQRKMPERIVRAIWNGLVDRSDSVNMPLTKFVQRYTREDLLLFIGVGVGTIKTLDDELSKIGLRIRSVLH